MKKGIWIERAIYTALIIFLLVLLIRDECRQETSIPEMNVTNMTEDNVTAPTVTNVTYTAETASEVSLRIDDIKTVKLENHKRITEVEITLENSEDSRVNVYIYDANTEKYDGEYVRHRQEVGQGSITLELDRPASFKRLGPKKTVVVELIGEEGHILNASRQFSI